MLHRNSQCNKLIHKPCHIDLSFFFGNHNEVITFFSILMTELHHQLICRAYRLFHIIQAAVTPIPEVEPFIKGLINLRGKIIPVIDVADRFGKEASPYNDRTCVIVIEVSGIEVGLIINSIAQVVSIEEQDILPPPNMAHGTAPQNKFVRGIGKMEDGVKLLLDPVKLLSDDALNFVDKQENEEEE